MAIAERGVRCAVPGRLSDEQLCDVFQKALRVGGLITEEHTSVIFYDLSFLEQRIENLIELFPSGTLHCTAIKAAPFPSLLRNINANGLGLEAASLPELHLAINAGFPPERIVFDSPAKTKEEIEFALALGIHVNVDSFGELERLNSLLRDRPLRGTIGIRINPQVGRGQILATSLADHYSKFGVPLNESREELKQAFLTHEWLTGVHVHIGSQGASLEMLLSGVEKVFGFVCEVNAVADSDKRINIFDLGGGLPVSYYRDSVVTSMSEYKGALNSRFPELFTDRFNLVTEFGRYVYANSGWVASRVEYVKRGKSINTAVIHVGADLFLRECYNPQDWHHEFVVVDRDGNPKIGVDDLKYVIAGPLCFAGDVIAREIALPRVEAGDYIIIEDAGAYTLSMWSRYNSRQVPRVVGYCDQGTRFKVLRERETIDDVLRFWR